MPNVMVGGVEQLPKGEGRTFDVGGRRLALFRTRAGDVFASQAACPHKGGPLADGLVGGTTVICPLHDRQYDLRTGIGIETECAIVVYPVSLGDDARFGSSWQTTIHDSASPNHERCGSGA